MEFLGPCPDYYFNADSNHTVASLSACIDALAARTCTDVAMALYPSCFSGGKRPEGAPCTYGWQCSSRACGGGQPCGVCRPGGLLVGAPCFTNGSCQAGAYCAALVCIDGARVAHNAEGQPCDLSAIPAIGCAGDLQCAPTQSGGTAGTCTAAPGASQPCGLYGVCRTGTACTSRTGGTCVDTTTCGTGVACPPNSYCKTVDGGATCAPRAALGEPCTPYPTTLALSPCVPPAFCFGTSAQAKCVLLRDIGEPCDDNSLCNGPLSCENGTCPKSPSCPVDGGAD
jgi:hypothetical protein